jgi:hypothetical protein
MVNEAKMPENGFQTENVVMREENAKRIRIRQKCHILPPSVNLLALNEPKLLKIVL